MRHCGDQSDILPYIAWNKVSEKWFSRISLQEHEEILLRGFLLPLPLPAFLSHSFQSSNSCQVYSTVFHSWSQKASFFFSFSPLQTHLYSKMFFPSCPRRLRKCQVFFVYAKDPVKIMAYGSSFFLLILTSFPRWLYGLSPASGPEWGIPCHPKGKLQSLPKLYRGVKKTGWGEAVDFPLHHALLRCSMLRLYLGAVTIVQNQPSLGFQKPYLKLQVCLDKSITGIHSTSRMISVTWEIYHLSDTIFSACSSFFPVGEKTPGESLWWWNGKIWLKYLKKFKLFFTLAPLSGTKSHVKHVCVSDNLLEVQLIPAVSMFPLLIHFLCSDFFKLQK